MLRGVLEQGAAATVSRIAEQYGESAQPVQADLDSLLHDLRRRGLVDAPILVQQLSRLRDINQRMHAARNGSA